MFIKYGCDKHGLLPYDLFATKLLSSPARLMALEPEQRVGACARWRALMLLTWHVSAMRRLA